MLFQKRDFQRKKRMANKVTTCTRGHNMEKTRKYHQNGDSYCSTCKALRTKEFRKNNPEITAVYGWRSNMKRRYGLNEESYSSLFIEQNGKCKVCKTSLEYKSKSTHIDHNHETLEVRGLLCHGCNTAIGLLREDKGTILSLLNYLFGENFDGKP